MTFTIAALYRFAPFDDPAALRQPLLDLCAARGVKGTLLLAREGANIEVVSHGEVLARSEGNYDASRVVFQERYPLKDFGKPIEALRFYRGK